jgi:hypothetical protein
MRSNTTLAIVRPGPADQMRSPRIT